MLEISFTVCRILKKRRVPFFAPPIPNLGGFTYLHSRLQDSASVKLGIRLPITSFVVKSFTVNAGKRHCTTTPTGCPTETEEMEENNDAPHHHPGEQLSNKYGRLDLRSVENAASAKGDSKTGNASGFTTSDRRDGFSFAVIQKKHSQACNDMTWQ